jgi:hypothetical protein
VASLPADPAVIVVGGDEEYAARGPDSMSLCRVLSAGNVRLAAA